MAEEEAEKNEEKEAKKRRKGVHSYYRINERKLERVLPTCERCGSGYFMASHADRYTCGHCGFTRYKQTETGA